MVDCGEAKHAHIFGDFGALAVDDDRRVALQLIAADPAPAGWRIARVVIERAGEIDQIDVLMGGVAAEGADRLDHNRRRRGQLRRIAVGERRSGGRDLDGHTGLLDHLAQRGLNWVLAWLDMAAGREPEADLAVPVQQRPAALRDEGRDGEVPLSRHTPRCIPPRTLGVWAILYRAAAEWRAAVRGRGVELISAANGMSPAWSPDGAQIAFLSNRAEGWDLYVVDAGGGEPRRLTSGATADDPAWHPDGRAIAVERRGEIELVPADGGGRSHLVERGAQPAWTTDGRLAFVRDGDLWLRSANGEESLLLVDASQPAWSPDGERIAAARLRGIAMLDLDSGATSQLTDQAGDDAPAWEPSGVNIAFVRRGAIWAVEAGGGEAAPIAGLPSPAGGPAYAPQPSRRVIAFHLHRDGNWDVAVADLQAGALRLLTEATWVSWNVRG